MKTQIRKYKKRISFPDIIMNSLEFLRIRNLILLLALSSLLSCGINEDDHTDINPVLIGKGELSGAGYEGIQEQKIILSNSEDWNELKNRMDSVNNETEGFSETEIDFSDYLVIAVFDQVRPSGGFSVEIKSIVENSDVVIVTIENIIPTGLVTGVITQPYHIVKIPVTTKRIVFN